MPKVKITQDCDVIEQAIESGRTINKRVKLKVGEIYSGHKASDLVDARKAVLVESEKDDKKKATAKAPAKKKATAKKKK